MRSRGVDLLILAFAIFFIGLIFFVMTTKAAAACHPEPVTPNTPSGIAGCYQWGKGIASHYGPGNGVAMNFCTWTFRHKHGCGSVKVTSIDTGLVVRAPVVDYCDCLWTTDRRIVDLQWGVLAQLGLDPSRGLYPVTVYPAAGERGGRESPFVAMTPSPESLPDTAMP